MIALGKADDREPRRRLADSRGLLRLYGNSDWRKFELSSLYETIATGKAKEEQIESI